ncbi:hypothetical protein [Paucibacter soli]|uniref:hypothetical protein n=1 Tax=Paucibacter soli TaxID=3133433 RepID=UPI0030AE7D72
MQHAKPIMKAVAVTILTLSATASFALLPPSGASAPTAEVPKTVNAAAVKAVAIGKPAAVEQGTLRELESLQRLAALAELRKKVAEATPTIQAQQTPNLSTATPVLTATPTLAHTGNARGNSKGNKATLSTQPQSAPPLFASPPMHEPVVPPTAKVLKVILVAGRARADLISDGKITTVKQGDQLGRWTVAEISPEGVTVHRRLTPLQIMQPIVTTELGASRSPEAVAAASVPQPAPTASASMQAARSASLLDQGIEGVSDAAMGAMPSGIVQVQTRRDYETYKLIKATDADLQVSSANTPRQSSLRPEIPPLPAGIAKPDSSFQPAVAPPLPGNVTP